MNPRHAARLAALAGLALAQAALAQNALDRNLQVGSGGVNPARPSFADEVRFRNAIVTGNAPGGISFRGDVGYRAPGEFTQRLGSDQDFAFRRDSFYSGLGGLGIRATDALQYQFSMTTGNAPPRSLGVSPEFYRAGARQTAAAINETPSERRGPESLFDPRRSAEDRETSTLLSMRSPSSFAANRGLQPSIFGVATGPDGQPIPLTASVLRGISITLPPTPETPDQAQQPVDPSLPPGAEAGPGQTRPGERPGETPGEQPGRPGDRLNADPAAQRQDLSIDTSASPTRSGYGGLMERLKEAAPAAQPSGVPYTPGATEPAQPTEPEWQRRLNELRGQLAEPSRTPTRAPAPGARPDPGDPRNPNDPRTAPPEGPAQPGTEQRPSASEREQAARERRRSTDLRPETLEMLRRAGGEIATLAPPSFDAYGVQMQAGQDALSGNRFFDAEERFTAALGIKPRDPMASVGRVHAELGAGMFRSAAINLRSILTSNPELAAAKYTPELLPSKDRLVRIAEKLTGLATEPGSGRGAALLLAYVGYQINDPAAINRGLDLMGTPGQNEIPADGDELTRLADLLRGVWIKPAGGGESK